jgi:hypothetical protein
MLAWNTASCSAGVRRSSSAADITLGPMSKGYQPHAASSIRSLGTRVGVEKRVAAHQMRVVPNNVSLTLVVQMLKSSLG